MAIVATVVVRSAAIRSSVIASVPGVLGPESFRITVSDYLIGSSYGSVIVKTGMRSPPIFVTPQREPTIPT